MKYLSARCVTEDCGHVDELPLPETSSMEMKGQRDYFEQRANSHAMTNPGHVVTLMEVYKYS